MENTHLTDFEDDTLSLSDLPLRHQQQESESKTSLYVGQHHTNQDFFEFSTSLPQNHHFSPDDNIIFCGKIIPCNKTQHPSNDINGDQTNPTVLSNTKKIAANLPFSAFKPCSPKRLMPRSVSGNSRKYKVLIIGLPAKVPTKMKLSDIKERQSRRAPTPMFRSMVADETPVGVGDSQNQKDHFGFRHLICKFLLLSRGFPKASFGCFPRARPCLEY